MHELGETPPVLMWNRCELGETRGGGDVLRQLAVTIDGDPGARIVPDRAQLVSDKLATLTSPEEPSVRYELVAGLSGKSSAKNLCGDDAGLPGHGTGFRLRVFVFSSFRRHQCFASRDRLLPCQ